MAASERKPDIKPTPANPSGENYKFSKDARTERKGWAG